MRSIDSVLISSVAFAWLLQPAYATMLTNPTPPSPTTVVATGTIERGGTVDAVNAGQKTITVDGRTYSLATTTVIVHDSAGKDNEKILSLKPGMKIRFNTTKNNYAGQDRINEIWITNANTVPNKK